MRASRPLRAVVATALLIVAPSAFGAPSAPAAPPSAPAAPSSGASEPGVNAEARDHYQRGVAYYKEGDFKLSLGEFRRAYELSRNYRVLYNLGRVHQQLNDYAQALIALEQYLAQGGAAIPSARREEVEIDVADLRGKTAHLEVAVDVADADVFVDGVPIGKSPLVAPVLLDAGDHHIEVQRSGYETARKFVTLAARDSTKLALHLEETKARVVVAPASGTVTREAAPAPRSTAPVWIGWASAGALAVGAGITGGLAASKASQLDGLVASPTSTAEQRAAVKSQAHTLAVASDVLAVSALAASGVALYFTLRSGGETSRQARVSAGLCGAGVCAAGRF